MVTRPEQEVAVEQAQGSYQYTDSSDTYEGRFVLRACDESLAIDLYAFYFPAANIRYSSDSSMVYLPLYNQLLILKPDAYLPLEGWEVPMKPLAAAYEGIEPENPDSVSEKGDTTITWKQGTAYLTDKESGRLLNLRGESWELKRKGNMEGNAHRAQKIVFAREDARLSMEFTGWEIIQGRPSRFFTLNPAENVEVLDFR